MAYNQLGVPIPDRIAELSAPADPVTGCINWLGTIDSNGYGVFSIKRRRQMAHRIAYELFVGPIPDGLSSTTCAATEPASTSRTSNL